MFGTLGTLAAQFALIGSLAFQPIDTGPYSAESIWDWSQYFTALPEKCPTPAWFDMRPNERVEDAECVAAAMRDWGASESAIQFFETTGQFLQSFDENGRIDSGLASSPWVNDGRGEAVLLNGSPSAMLISSVIGNATQGWQTQPGYAELSRSCAGRVRLDRIRRPDRHTDPAERHPGAGGMVRHARVSRLPDRGPHAVHPPLRPERRTPRYKAPTAGAEVRAAHRLQPA